MVSEENSLKFTTAVDWLRSAERIVVFTGAGISTASGIATFRDDGGFWTRFPPEDFANWKGLLQTAILQPKRMAEFLVAVLEPIATASPNDAHRAIAKLERFKPVDVITQNIDRLHQDAGSRKVSEIHGNLFEVVSYPRQEECRELTKMDLLELVRNIKATQSEIWAGPKLLKAISPLMGASLQGTHRPNLVLFGDQLAEPDWGNAQDSVQRCDLFISVGTSQSGYPAAELPVRAKEAGSRCIVIDPEVGGVGDLWFAAPAEQVLPQLVSSAFPELTEEQGDHE
ncbi:SIR2 family NAD-dependent protein deacylase [Thalassoglobus sp.]|uniref:SIR2 family NAD-dependent protein deacylase n=1 Tax=Thalassoglobus sp. TaxID=2795869 RepID=UPI003AA9CC64